MRNDELVAAFDQQAAGYDRQWAKLSPLREGLHFLLESVFAELPADARVLCVGAGRAQSWLTSPTGFRKLPGFKSLVRKMGVADFWREYGWADLCQPLGSDDFECS